MISTNINFQHYVIMLFFLVDCWLFYYPCTGKIHNNKYICSSHPNNTNLDCNFKIRRKIFIDAGSNDGTSLIYFALKEGHFKEEGGKNPYIISKLINKARTSIKELKDLNEWYIYAFEMNPAFSTTLSDLLSSLPIKKGKLCSNAVWIKSGIREAYFQEEKDAVTSKITGLKYNMTGSSIFDRSSSKIKPLKGKKTIVHTINFVKWLQNTLCTQDYVILKIDVEGAEYELCKELMKNPKTLKLLDELYIEWHGEKIRPDIRNEKQFRKEFTTFAINEGVKVAIWPL